MSDLFAEAAANQRRVVDDIIAAEPDPVRRAVAIVGASAADTATSWQGITEHLQAAAGQVPSERARRRLNRAADKARDLSRTATALGRDVEHFLALEEVKP